MTNNFTEDFRRKCYKIFKTHPDLVQLLQALEDHNIEGVKYFMEGSLKDIAREDLEIDDDLKADIRNINKIFIDEYIQ